MNWKVYERSETLLVATDKPFSTFEKEHARTPSATIKIKAKSVAAGAGVSWGDGTLVFQGKDYPITLSGLSLLDLGCPALARRGRCTAWIVSVISPVTTSPVRRPLPSREAAES